MVSKSKAFQATKKQGESNITIYNFKTMERELHRFIKIILQMV
jgi:hypothetical protein